LKNEVRFQSIDNNFSKEVSNDQTSIEEIVDHQWNKLFQDFSQRKCAEKYKYQYMGYDFNNKTYVLPKANLNMERKYSKIGQGQVAYLFDYLDDVFQKPIANYFLKLWNDAKSVIEDAHYKDPYDIDLVLNEAEKLLMTPKARELNYTVKASSMSPQEIAARMKMISHKFDYEIGIGDWGLGLTNPQSPIPNPHPQSPIKLIFHIIICFKLYNFYLHSQT
jgi:hypothetical protein